MKKFVSMILAVVMIVSCTVVTAFASDGGDCVGVQVQYVDYEQFSELGNEMATKTRASVVDLSSGDDFFSAGVLDAKETYITSTYNITKTTMKFSLTSYDAASPHIEVTLYKSSNGSSVAVKTVSLVKSSLIGGKAAIIEFTNLDTTVDYYAGIKNIDTGESGNIKGYVGQK